MAEAAKLAEKKYESPEIKNRDRNKLFHDDRQFHDWYRFVLSYPPQLVRDYLTRFQLKRDALVFDPFCGTGTTIVEAKFEGFCGVGFEANRFAHFASEVKSNWAVDGSELLETAERIRDLAIHDLAEVGVTDDVTHSVDLFRLERFTAEQNALILRNSFSPLPLHKSLVLLKHIRRYEGGALYKPLALALANVAVFRSSNLRFGPEVGIGKIKADAPVITPWFEQVTRMAKDLMIVKDRPFPSSHVIYADSRTFNGELSKKSISAVITSPPYPNEKDYTRTTRLESVLLGLISSKQELRENKRGLLRSNTRGVYKGDDDDKYVENVAEVQRIAKAIEERRTQLQKTSGFEKLYATVTKLYFGGMARHFHEIQPYLKKGAQLAYVVGDQASYLQVMIRTGHILAEIAESLGYVDVEVVPFRTRFSTTTKSELNEEVVIFSWPR